MKKKIAIFGSTGSIGQTLIDIVGNDKENFKIVLLTAQKNYKKILKQAKQFNVNNLIITDEKYYKIAIKKKNNKNLKIFNNFDNLDKILNKKIDFTMSAISGIEGLKPTLNSIKFTKKIAIANKESIICGWNIIKKELKKNKTEFIPVDSEHFSIWYACKNNFKSTSIEKIYITASGGPFNNLPLKKFKDIKVSQALKHPNWKMGKKISIDSATMINKIFEIIEAKKIFNISYNDLKILVHPHSYVHSIIKSSDGMIKIIAHDTSMKIPIFNSIYSNENKIIKTNKLSINKLNNLQFNTVNEKKFPLVKLISKFPKYDSLYETVLVSANDELVTMFLENKIKFTDISSNLLKILNSREFIKYKKIKPNNIYSILELSKYVRLKINSTYI